MFKCGIQSMELFPMVRTPQLTTLFIHYNGSIVSLKPFRKAHFPSLNYISMRTEFVSQKETRSARAETSGRCCPKA